MFLQQFPKKFQSATSKQVWDTLKQVYGNSGKIKKVKLHSLRRHYELIAMNHQETISDYFRLCNESVEDCKFY